ncbi:MAG TPA: hypothetical protein VEC60_03005, partial [Reyranella sp.]|nr:hypothetical protein [Reyranella sp.]
TTYTLLLRQQFMRRMIEASTVSSMDLNPRPMRPDRRAERKEAMEPPRAVEGRSLRNASEAKLGPTLSGIDAAALVRTLLPRHPLDPVETGRTPGAIVAAAMLDPVYQLK